MTVRPHSSRKKKKPGRIFLKLVAAVVLAALLLLGVPFSIVQIISMNRVYEDLSEVPSHDVGMVMGAAIWNNQPSPYLRGRLDVALQLYRTGQLKVIIVSGSISDNEPAVMRKYLVENGVAYSDVVLDEAGNDSYSSCAHAVNRFGVKKLVVISQTYHLPRTVAACRILGIDAIGAADTTQPEGKKLDSYRRREILANVKLMVDAITKRQPYSGPRTDEVDRALARHG